MGWERRGPNGRPYYYRKSRDAQGRVVSTYHGSGPVAHLVGDMDAAARAHAAYRAAALEAFAADVDAADRATRAFTADVKGRLAQALEAAGYRHHRGEWRRPRRRTDPAAPAGTAEGPGPGEAADEG